MDDLIGRLVANSGDRTAAERAVGIVSQLLRRAEPSLSTMVLLSTGRIQLVTCKTIGAAREIAWEDAVGGIVGAIPASASLSDAR